MALQPVQSNTYQPITPSIFNEGSQSTANKVTAIVLVVLTSLISFLLLPMEFALGVASIGALFLIINLCGSEATRAMSVSPQFSSVTHVVHPVLNPGPRIVVANRRPEIAEVSQPIRVRSSAAEIRPDRRIQRQQREHVPVGRRETHAQSSIHTVVDNEPQQPEPQRQQRQKERLPVGRGHMQL